MNGNLVVCAATYHPFPLVVFDVLVEVGYPRSLVLPGAAFVPSKMLRPLGSDRYTGVSHTRLPAAVGRGNRADC